MHTAIRALMSDVETESDGPSLKEDNLEHNRCFSEIPPFVLPSASKPSSLFSLIHPFIDNHLCLSPFPRTKRIDTAYDSKLSLKPNGSMNLEDDALFLIDLYKDIQSTNQIQLNVTWKHPAKDTGDHTQVTQQMLSILPTPTYDNLMDMRSALDTTYHQCIYQESPRYTRTNFVCIHSDHWLRRDCELQGIHDDIVSKAKAQTMIEVSSEQYENHTQFKKAIESYLKINDEYEASPSIQLADGHELQHDVLEIFAITENDIDVSYHAALLKQKGLRCKTEIAPFVVIGQYLGNEISSAMFDKKGVEIERMRAYDGIFTWTSGEHLHTKYAFDHVIECASYDIHFVLDPLPLDVSNQETLSDCESLVCPLIFINDCRHNVEKNELLETDKRYQNIEYVFCKVNGWSQIYVITTKSVKENEQFWGYYGNDLSKQISNESKYEQDVKQLKQRLDSKHDILQTIFDS